MKPLTFKQARLLDWIIWYVSRHGYSPSYKEMAEMLDAHLNAAARHVVLMEKKGYVKRHVGVMRNVAPLRDSRGNKLVRVPRLEVRRATA